VHRKDFVDIQNFQEFLNNYSKNAYFKYKGEMPDFQEFFSSFQSIYEVIINHIHIYIPYQYIHTYIHTLSINLGINLKSNFLFASCVASIMHF